MIEVSLDSTTSFTGGGEVAPLIARELLFDLNVGIEPDWELHLTLPSGEVVALTSVEKDREAGVYRLSAQVVNHEQPEALEEPSVSLGDFFDGLA